VATDRLVLANLLSGRTRRSNSGVGVGAARRRRSEPGSSDFWIWKLRGRGLGRTVPSDRTGCSSESGSGNPAVGVGAPNAARGSWILLRADHDPPRRPRQDYPATPAPAFPRRSHQRHRLPPRHSPTKNLVGPPHSLFSTVAPFRAWRGSRCAVGGPLVRSAEVLAHKLSVTPT
jgi:hypothetical protein